VYTERRAGVKHVPNGGRVATEYEKLVDGSWAERALRSELAKHRLEGELLKDTVQRVLGLHYRTVLSFYKGHGSFRTFEKLAAFLGMSVEEFTDNIRRDRDGLTTAKKRG
jgi:hypothetical protein